VRFSLFCRNLVYIGRCGIFMAGFKDKISDEEDDTTTEAERRDK